MYMVLHLGRVVDSANHWEGSVLGEFTATEARDFLNHRLNGEVTDTATWETIYEVQLFEPENASH